MNRSYCNMKLFNFDECIADCKQVLGKMKSCLEGERDEERKKGVEEKMVKFRCRLGIALGW